jgi:hypothetical protein
VEGGVREVVYIISREFGGEKRVEERAVKESE